MLLYKISQGIANLISEKGNQAGLSATQVRAVMFLSDAHRDSRDVSSVARQLGIAQPTTTRVIDSLEEKGLVERKRRDDDRRKVELKLTNEGKETAMDFTDISESLQENIGNLPEGIQEELNHGLIEIVGIMQEKGQLSASLTCKYCRFFEPGGGATKERPHHCNLTNEDLSEEESRKEWVHGEDHLRLIEESNLDQ